MIEITFIYFQPLIAHPKTNPRKKETHLNTISFSKMQNLLVSNGKSVYIRTNSCQ